MGMQCICLICAQMLNSLYCVSRWILLNLGVSYFLYIAEFNLLILKIFMRNIGLRYPLPVMSLDWTQYQE